MGIKPEHASVCEGGIPGTESCLSEEHCSALGQGERVYTCLPRDPLVLWEILVALGVGELFLGQD